MTIDLCSIHSEVADGVCDREYVLTSMDLYELDVALAELEAANTTFGGRRVRADLIAHIEGILTHAAPRDQAMMKEREDAAPGSP